MEGNYVIFGLSKKLIMKYKKSNKGSNCRLILGSTLGILRSFKKKPNTNSKITQKDLAKAIWCLRSTVAIIESWEQTVTSDIRLSYARELWIESEIFDLFINFLEWNKVSKDAAKFNPLFKKIFPEKEFPEDLMNKITSDQTMDEDEIIRISRTLANNIVRTQKEQLAKILDSHLPTVNTEITLILDQTDDLLIITVGNKKIRVSWSDLKFSIT